MAIRDHKTSIALVEANERLRSTIGDCICEQGYLVTSAPNSEQGLDIVAEADIAVVDLILEDMDGLSLIEEIRSKHRCKHIIAILPSLAALSRLDMKADDITLMASQSGANAVFVAPFNLGELLTTLERFSEALTPSAA